MSLLWTTAAGVPVATGRESVQHILKHYKPWDADTWDEVREMHDWHHPDVADFVDDIARNGVQRPIPIDYHESPPRVRNGHTRLLAAEKAGVKDVPVRQHEGWLDPDDPDHLGRQPDHPDHYSNWAD